MREYTHKHHIIPRHMGGSDDPSNIIELSIDEHAEAHRILYEKHGKKEDYIAWKCLQGVWSKKEIVKELSLLAGIKGGETNRISGHMSRLGKSISSEERAIRVGRAVEVMRERRLGCFFNPDLHRIVAAKGGKAQGKINAENGHCSRIAKDYWGDVKSGKRVHKKRMWITNGIESRLIGVDETIPDTFYKGRVMP